MRSHVQGMRASAGMNAVSHGLGHGHHPVSHGHTRNNNYNSHSNGQEYEYAAVLQRIIQDYLAGKQLSLVEQQLMQQYIQMEQQKRVTQMHAQEAQQREQEMIAQRLYQEQLERLGRMGVGGGMMGGMGGMGGMMGGMSGMDAAYGMRAPGNVQSGGFGVIGGGSGHGNGQQQRRQGAAGHHTNGHNGHNVHNSHNGHNNHTNHTNHNSHKHAGRGTNGGYAHGNTANAGGKMQPNPAVNPMQTLQEIGRTLSELGITVEVAVNAGLLGGLSASDVRIVADAHRVENELKGLGAAGHGDHSGDTHGNNGRVRFTPPGSAEPHSPNKGIASAPVPSSPAWSVGSLSRLPSGPVPVSADFTVPGEHGPDDTADVAAGAKSSRTSGSSVNTSTVGDETASGSASLFGDQQKDDDSGGDETVKEELGVADCDANINSYLDSLSLGTSW